MRKKIFIVIISFILITTSFISISSVYALSLSESINSADGLLNKGKSELINYSFLYGIINFLYKVVMLIGIIIAIIVGTGLGIRIIFGSLDERADAKHLIVPYFIIVTMMAFGLTIWRAVLGLIYNKI